MFSMLFPKREKVDRYLTTTVFCCKLIIKIWTSKYVAKKNQDCLWFELINCVQLRMEYNFSVRNKRKDGRAVAREGSQP